MPASLILRTSSLYSPLSASASCFTALYSKERALMWSNSALTSAAGLFKHFFPIGRFLVLEGRPAE